MIGLPKISKIVLNIIIINVLIFLAVYLSPFAKSLGMGVGELVGYLRFNFPGEGNFEVHQVVTHMFMHQGIVGGQISYRHLLMNMVGLFFLGTYVEQALGDKKFIKLYFAAGMGALLAHIIVGYVTGATNPVLGASGAVYGVVVAYATLFPNRTLMIIPIPVPIKAKWLAAGYIAYDLFYGLSGMASNVAHFAHLGGALTGYLVARYYKQNGFS